MTEVYFRSRVAYHLFLTNVINCSRRKSVAINLVLWSSNAIIRLTDFSFDPFDFSVSKTGNDRRASNSLRAFRLTKLDVCESPKLLET